MEEPLPTISESDLIKKLGNYEFIPKEAYDLDLRTLSYEEYGILGHGYNMVNNYATQDGESNRAAIIDIEKLKNSSDKEWLNINTEYRPDLQILIGETAKDFIDLYRNKIGTLAHIPAYGNLVTRKFFPGNMNSSDYSSKDLYASLELRTSNQSIYIISSFHDYNSEMFKELRNNYLTPTFANFVIHATPKSIVENFGTHVLVNIKQGACFELNWTGQTNEPNRKLQAKSALQFASQKIEDYNLYQGQLSEEINSKNFNSVVTYRARGGDVSIPIIKSIDVNNLPNFTYYLQDWINSITNENRVLIDFNENGVIPIYDFINDPIKREEVKVYLENYFKVNSVYQYDESSPIYRTYSDKAFNHLYSLNLEKEDLTTYSDGLLAFQAYSYRAPNTFPVYRYYSKNLMNHFYVLEKGESIPSYPGYDLERIAFYAYDSPGINRNPIYRAYGYREEKRNHFYTKNHQEYLNILKNEPYKGEDIFFYAH